MSLTAGSQPRRWLALAAGCAVVGTLVVTSGAGASTPTAPAMAGNVLQILPPGESANWTATDEANGRLTGNYGPHTADMAGKYWSFHYINGNFAANSLDTQPAPGVRIYRDSSGVPDVFGDNGRDVWFGAGYAAATDRLFELDAIRRLATGRLAELVGPSSVPDDVATRTLTYTPAEYQAMFDRLPTRSKAAIRGYVAGVNQRINEVRLDPTQLPAEYALLTSEPEPISSHDVLAMGVLMTRLVASQGGNELDNVSALRELVKRYGASKGRAAFDDLFWQHDAKAVTTIPGSEARFSNDDTPAEAQAAVTRHIERWALRLPSGLASGSGTGGYPEPATPDSVGPPPAVKAAVGKAAASLLAWARALHGGSYQLAVSGSRTRDGKPLLETAPQLGWTAPSELYILEVHGGGYDARGATVPGLPVVGIGYTPHTAWALTTGYSKTIDSFIETTRPNPDGTGPPQYLHDGSWHDEACHDTTVHYRPATNGVPFGPPIEEVVVPVCRTVHGPVVASHGRHARSVEYAMWKHETDTVNGVLQWDRADNLKQFARGVRQVTWNENVMYAGTDGHIAYWHPGRYPVRSPDVDQRFPAPGTGAYDWRGLRPFSTMPHVVDPKQGWLANWNTLPAKGWNSGDVEGYSAGPFDHVQVLMSQLRHAHDLTLRDLVRIDNHVGNSDARSVAYLPLLRRLSKRLPETATRRERTALRLLARWNGQAADPAASVDTGGKDPAAATLFDAWVHAIRRVLFAKAIPADLFRRTTAVALHKYDVTTLDNVAMRVLAPRTSSLRPALNYLHGRSRSQVELAALDRAMRSLAKRFGTRDMTKWRRPHPVSQVDSLTGVVGPSFSEPYEDRGTYIHLVGF
jgi:penicillin amidase